MPAMNKTTYQRERFAGIAVVGLMILGLVGYVAQLSGGHTHMPRAPAEQVGPHGTSSHSHQ